MQIPKDLILSCQARKREAQHAMYKILLPYMKPIAKRYLRNNQYVLDVLQESFVKIFTDIQQYDFDKGAFHSWATRIVINTSINYNNRIIGMYKDEVVDDILSLETQAQQDNELLTKEQLLQILRAMPKGYFEVFNLFVIDGYDHEEIADILEIKASLSRKKLSRAREWLKKSNFMEQIIALLFLINLVFSI